MDELEEQRELDRLIAEQELDDTPIVFHDEPGHRDDVSFEGLDCSMYVADTYFEGTKDDHSSLEQDITPVRDRGTVLVGSASYHGTITGYRKHGCKCDPCKAAHAKHQREWRERKKQEAAS